MHMCMNNWITVLYTWNQHHVVNQLYFNKKIKKKKNKFKYVLWIS